MSELDVKRDRIFKMYERMCGRKPDMVVQDLLNLLMRDEMRPLVRDLICEYNRVEIVEKARGIVGGRIRADIIDTPYGTIDESEIIGRWSSEHAEIRGGFAPSSAQASLFDVDHG